MTPDRHGHVKEECIELRSARQEKREEEAVTGLLTDLADRDPDLHHYLLTRLAKGGAGESKPAVSGGSEGEPIMIGESPPMRRAFKAIRRFATTDAPTLITGESGTGKELVALAIHERSAFASGPFMPINCAGLPATLISTELFGHEKGAFTGASHRKTGRIEAAEGGTVFLDEIGDMPMELQAHLLRFLQERTIERVGGHRQIPVNVRVLAATNKELAKELEAGRFRQDLYFRLNVLSLEMPSLRDRGDDIVLISNVFLKRFLLQSQPAGDPPGKPLLARGQAEGDREVLNQNGSSLFGVLGNHRGDDCRLPVRGATAQDRGYDDRQCRPARWPADRHRHCVVAVTRRRPGRGCRVTRSLGDQRLQNLLLIRQSEADSILDYGEAIILSGDGPGCEIA